MTNYDTEIRRIADEVRHVLNNCTDAPRLLREYAGLYTEDEAQRVIATPLKVEMSECRTALATAEVKIDELRDVLSEYLD